MYSFKETSIIKRLWDGKFLNITCVTKIRLIFYSTKQSHSTEKSYSKTVNLPQTKFPAYISGEKRRNVDRDLLEVSIFVIPALYLRGLVG